MSGIARGPGTYRVIDGLSRQERLSRFGTQLWALVRRDLAGRYRRAALGPLWAVLQPLTLMALFTVVHDVIALPSEGLPYALFSYAALVPWQFLSGAVQRCASSLLYNVTVLKKAALRREVFPLAAVAVALADAGASALILAAMMGFYRVRVGLALLWLPLLVLLAAVLALAVGMALAALGAFVRDLTIATPFLVQVWMYLSPVLYPLSAVPERWRTLYALNPAVGLIEGFRAVLLRAQPPDPGTLALSALLTLAALALSWPLFRALSGHVADVL